MEPWITVVVAVIVALSTLSATWLQNKHSAKRFEKELERQKEVDSHQWRRKVRGEPLFKLREELAVMASKQERLATFASRHLTRSGIIGEDEEIKERLRQAQNELNTYMTSGILQKILLMQDDEKFIKLVEKINEDYWVSSIVSLYNKEFDEKTIKEINNSINNNNTRIIEIQELINKKLEEL